LKSVHSEKYARFLKVMVGARQEAGLTQQQLANVLRKPQSYVSKYERGEKRLDVIEFLDISSALKMDASDVVDALKEAGKSVKAKGGRV
jgi:transcriptional regulator with XRE-family HTH domain